MISKQDTVIHTSNIYQIKQLDISRIINTASLESLQVDLTRVDRLNKALAQWYNQYHVTIDKTLKEIISYQNRVYYAVNDNIAKINKEIYDSLREANKVWEASVKAMRYQHRIYLVLKELEWPPIFDQFDPFWTHLVKSMNNRATISDDDFRVELCKEIRLYLKTLDSSTMIGIWNKNPLMQPRVCIVKQAIQAHKRGMYYVSVPALIAQIEGMIWNVIEAEYVRVEGKKPHYNRKYAKIKSSITSITDEVRKREPSLDIPNIDLLILALFRNEGATAYSKIVSRHEIMHGKNLTYGNWETSGRLIILINTLQLLLLEYWNKNCQCT